MKKILLCVLILAVLLQSSFVFAKADASADTGSDISLLEEIGIYKPQDNMSESEELLTREKMTVQLCVFYGVERDGNIHEFSGESVYSDVDPDYYLAYEIMLLERKGCMSGFTDGTFRPENNVTCSQAVKALVTILGYAPMAEYDGGWFSGYMKKAEELGLLKGVNSAPNEFITRGDFTKLLMNALETETVKINAGADGSAEYTEDEILLNRLGYEKIRGIVSATENVSLFGKDKAGKGKIIIGNTLIECSGNFDGYIGAYVTAYCKQDKDMDFGELVYIEINENKTKIEEVTADKISEKSTISQFIYENGKGKEKKVTLGDDVTFIFNGRKLTFYTDEHIKPQNGSVRLIDSDGDSAYETVIVKSYVDFWVAGVYEKDEKIVLSDELGKNAIEIDMQDSDYDVSLSKNGSAAVFADILKKNIVSVAADKMSGSPLKISSDARAFDMIISDKTADGVLNGIDKEDKKITVGNEEFDLANTFDFSRFTLVLGREYTAYFNYDNKISAVKEKPSDKYGFITKVFADDIDEDAVYAKLYTQDGEFVTAQLAKGVKIDGTGFKNAQEIIDELSSASIAFFKDLSFGMTNRNGCEQLVKYRVNPEDNLSVIDTVKKNRGGDDGFSFGIKMEGSSSNVLHAFGHSQNFESGVGIDPEMVTFMLPSDAADEDGYGILSNGAVYSDLIKTDVYAYDLSELNVAKVCIMNASAGDNIEVKESNNMMIVTKVTSGIDSDDMPVMAVSGVKIKTGLEYELEVLDTVVNKDKIKPGMIIRWNADSRDRAKTVEIAYSRDNSGTVLNNVTPTTSYYSDFRIAAGKALNMDNDYIMIGYDTDGVLKKETYALRNITNVFVYDENAKEKVVKSSINAIKTEKHFGTEASIVFSFQDYARLKTIVVYE